MAKEIDDILSQQGNKTQASPCAQNIPQESQSDAFKVKGLKKKEGLGKGRPRKRPKSWVELQQKRTQRRKPPCSNYPNVSIENSTMMSQMIPETPQSCTHPSMTHLFQQREASSSFCNPTAKRSLFPTAKFLQSLCQVFAIFLQSCCTAGTKFLQSFCNLVGL
ncbi:hypothetical protein U1Q18_002603 [Sarracenia purpurea var. burkii]